MLTDKLEIGEKLECGETFFFKKVVEIFVE